MNFQTSRKPFEPVPVYLVDCQYRDILANAAFTPGGVICTNITVAQAVYYLETGTLWYNVLQNDDRHDQFDCRFERLMTSGRSSSPKAHKRLHDALHNPTKPAKVEFVCF